MQLFILNVWLFNKCIFSSRGWFVLTSPGRSYFKNGFYFCDVAADSSAHTTCPFDLSSEPHEYESPHMDEDSVR